MRDMETFLANVPARDVIQTALLQLDEKLATRVRDALAGAESPNEVDWSEIPSEAGALADLLEGASQASQSWGHTSALLNTATMLRVRAGGRARRGRRFDWRKVGTYWAAGEEPSVWQLVPQGSGGRFGIIVASWDKPDWYAGDLETAKAIAEEIEARPKFSEANWIEELPFD